MKKLLMIGLITASVMGALLAPAAASGSTLESGYIPLQDGTQLKYTLMSPEDSVPLPTLLVYHGYGHREWLVGQYMRDAVLDGAYNLVVVSVRGSGCSGGSWEFLNPQEAEDGVDVIEWITQKPWSNGRVALVGGSYSAMPQFAVAAQWATEYPDRSDGLVAIAPQSPISDIYRDVAYPGGIPNHGFAAGFVALQGSSSYNSAAQGVVFDGSVDAVCLTNQSTRPDSVTHNTFTKLNSNRWDGPYYERSPIYAADKIDVPVFAFFAWQDQILSGRAIDVLSQLRAPYHAIVTNGDHDSYKAGTVAEPWREFLDYYVRGIDNGFGEQPPVEVWWESNKDGVPGFTSNIADWPAPQAKPVRLFLSEGGKLQEGAGTGGPDTFVYSSASQVPLRGETWAAKRESELVQAYTSEPLNKDLALLGPASVDLWLSSTSEDVDLQATITEVRPDGEEVYVQSGWLRASHRAVDPARSSDTRPFHTHQEQDAEKLIPLEQTQMRIEVFPFGHVFRAGSRIRIEIGGPTLVPAGWRLGTVPAPSTNAIYHDQDLQSSVVLSTLPGHPAVVPLPKCGSLRSQPCR